MQSHQKYVCLNPKTSVLDSSCPLCSAEMCFCTFETVGIKHMLTLFGPKNILATSNYERHSQKCLKVRCFPALNWLMLDHAVLSDVRQIPGHIQNIQNISNIQQLASNLIWQWRSLRFSIDQRSSLWMCSFGPWIFHGFFHRQVRLPAFVEAVP